MEIVKILGIDPSLRNTGMALVSYNTETKKYTVSNCQVLVNPAKYKGKDAIFSMLHMIKEESEKTCYSTANQTLVESPSVMYNMAWAQNTISRLAHISGGTLGIFGLEKTLLFSPSEWNRTKKKEVTHNLAVATLGDPEKWHYEKMIKSEKFLEHILDAASMALWYIKENYVEDKENVLST